MSDVGLEIDSCNELSVDALLETVFEEALMMRLCRLPLHIQITTVHLTTIPFSSYLGQDERALLGPQASSPANVGPEELLVARVQARTPAVPEERAPVN